MTRIVQDINTRRRISCIR